MIKYLLLYEVGASSLEIAKYHCLFLQLCKIFFYGLVKK